MHWIIQDNLHREDGFVSLLDTSERRAIPHDVVKVLPFSDHLDPAERMIPQVNPAGPVMVSGSTGLSKIAKQRGWTPGSFLNENHDYRVWQKHYGAHLLNAEARICRFADVEPVWSPFFLRPCDDSKAFAGTVIDWDSFRDWRRRVIDLNETYTSLSGDTMVSYGPVKKILREYRFFVVDGRVVTQSVYKIGPRVVYQPHVDGDAIAYAQSMVDLWQPARAFVIDVALTTEGHRVIEINCINSAGFYAIDVQKFVAAIEAMEL